jgi:hypothetical protein
MNLKRDQSRTCSGGLADAAFPGGDRNDVSYATDREAALRGGAVVSLATEQTL